MSKDENCDLGYVARKIGHLKATMKIHLKINNSLNADPRGERWVLMRDWSAECWRHLTRVMQGFYPKRLVRRLQRTLRRVDGVVHRGLAGKRRVELGSGTTVVSRRDEEGIFARLMALPRAEGQLLC